MSGGCLQHLPIRDDVVRPHDPVIALAADVQPRRHPALKAWFAPDFLRQPPGLVSGQGVHGVEDDRLDARPTDAAVAMVQHGIKEALGLARAGAGGDEGVLGLVIVLA